MALSSLVQKRLFILGGCVVLLLSVLLYWRISTLIDSFKHIDHANAVDLKLSSLTTLLNQAETNQRGFLLTGDSTFLHASLETRKQLDVALKQVQHLIKDNPRQEQNLTALQSLIQLRFYLMDATVNIQHDSTKSLQQYMTRGRASMERIRYHINRMTLIEHTDLVQHEHQKAQYMRLTPLSLLFLVFAMLAVIGFSYYGLTLQLQQTRKYATNLDDLNRELSLKNKQLENSVEELNAFNYIASHDLKEPLRKILFFTDMINGNGHQLHGETKQYLEKIHGAGERMKSLLDDLLTYAKAGMAERNMERLDLNNVVEMVADSLSEMMKEKNAEVTYQHLPEINAVRSQMLQLFENLMSNAVKYSQEAVPPVITISSELVSKQELPLHFEATHEWYHYILFMDNGIGFPQENADKIFVLFQRLHQRHEFSGTGIGLTICKKIVQNHNGYITAESEVGKGTTFSIYLPA